MTAREVIARIEGLGGVFVRQRGSHRYYRVTSLGGTVAAVVVPIHSKDIPTGTLHKIQKDLAPVFGEGWLIR